MNAPDEAAGGALGGVRPTRADPRCCASCVHVGVRHEGGRVVVVCRRLGYETRPEWRFLCWTPKPRVQGRPGGQDERGAAPEEERGRP
ncbi:MAG: hypothetical protein IMW98_08755 [Firmicutes bacterium]|nr:hypothetical protein [Bacillota bacterium]MBE3590896.1 hypothetical protein [Bacillota bacterium]